MNRFHTVRGPGQEFEVCIIGAGIAGILIALELARWGARTVLLEAGTETDAESSARDVYTSSGNAPYDFNANRARGLGGTSAIWSGVCPRMPVEDFKSKSLFDVSEDWPLPYEEVARYYSRAEQILGINRSLFDNKWESLRRFHHDGVSFETMPRSLERTNVVNAKAMNLKALLNRPDALGKLSVIANAVVRRLELDGNGRIHQVVYQRLGAQACESTRAKCYVLTAGAVESVRILLLSANPEFAAGVGNEGGWVGRGFIEHPFLVTKWLIDHDQPPCEFWLHSYDLYDRRQRLSRLSVLLEAWGAPYFEAAGDDSPPMHQDAGPHASCQIMLNALIEERAHNSYVALDPVNKDTFGDPSPHIRRSIGTESRQAAGDALKYIFRIGDSLGATPLDQSFFLTAGHQMGTCKMGPRMEDGVVDTNLRVHGVKNLFLVSTGVFPTGSGVNPTLTLSALALRAAAHIRKIAQHLE